MRRAERAFTLIEVVLALAILAITLMVLLEVQADNLNAASRARGLTIASLLARSKMIDIEQHLFDEGFELGDESEDGDFEEEGHADFKWSYTISEVEIDLSELGGLCGGFGEEGGDESDCSLMLGGLGGAMEGFTTELGNSMRLVELEVTWPEGKYTESMSVRAVVTREDFAFAAMGDTAFKEGIR
jgi:general secretion pathway protein I